MNYRHPQQTGQSLVEFIIAFIILIMLGLGAIQMGLIYRAKTTLEYAALQAARAGAVHHGNPAAIKFGLARGLAPLYANEASVSGAAMGLTESIAAACNPLVTRYQLINPTKKAFQDFKYKYKKIGWAIPNDNLAFRSHKPGAKSKLTLQDANVLKIRVVYQYRLIVPIIDSIIGAVINNDTPKRFGTLEWMQTGAAKYREIREVMHPEQHVYLPIEASAIVRMQSAFTKKSLKLGSTSKPIKSCIKIVKTL